MKKYEVLLSDTWQNFEKVVNAALGQGAELVGGVSVAHHILRYESMGDTVEEERTVYHQAVLWPTQSQTSA